MLPLLRVAAARMRGPRAQQVAGPGLRVPLAGTRDAPPVDTVPPVPLARWLASQRAHSTAVAGAACNNAPNTAAARAVLVKVGDAGRYSLVTYDALMAMDAMSLLKALRRDEGFALDLAGVSLQRCIVEVCASASDEKPSPDEAKSAVPLEGAKTLGVLAATALPLASLFVRVTLPASAAAAGATAELGELRLHGRFASLSHTSWFSHTRRLSPCSLHTPTVAQWSVVLTQFALPLPSSHLLQHPARRLGPCLSMRIFAFPSRFGTGWVPSRKWRQLQPARSARS